MFNKFISRLLDEMQQRKENSKDVFEVIVYNKIIKILEEYIK